MDESAGSLAGWYLCNHVMVEICSPRFERRQRESGLFLARCWLGSFQLGVGNCLLGNGCKVLRCNAM
eukprot:scaffold2522_cov108-Skeletonema_menzelii.AAC.1